MLNGSALNTTTLNGPAGGTSAVEDYDWEALAPVERQTIYQAKVGGLVVPMSSFQSTMRLTGQSFLQIIVPDGDAYVDLLEAEVGNPMVIEKGYRYADGTLSPLETIATAPFEILRCDEGVTRHSLTLSGYGPGITGSDRIRDLRGITYRSTNQRRRVRCEIDLFLRPGHTARDSDGLEFTVGVIQYFVGDASESMEVLEDG